MPVEVYSYLVYLLTLSYVMEKKEIKFSYIGRDDRTLPCVINPEKVYVN